MKNKTFREQLEEIVREIHHCGFNQQVDCSDHVSEITSLVERLIDETKTFRLVGTFDVNESYNSGYAQAIKNLLAKLKE